MITDIIAEETPMGINEFCTTYLKVYGFGQIEV